MDKVLLRSHGLELVKLQPEHIREFRHFISEENIKELDVIYNIDIQDALQSAVLRDMTFAVLKGKEVLAITGIDEGYMWSLFSKKMPLYWVRFARASRALIDFYHHFYDDIECIVWSENETILQWLLHLNFEVTEIEELSNSETLVHFVRCKSYGDNVHSLASRPVMH